MGAVLGFIRNLFRFHKLKFLVTLLFMLFFGFVLFPFDDLSDFVTNKIAEMTGGRWYVQFDTLGVNMLPVGLSMENVLVESDAIPQLKVGRVEVSPWVLGAIMAKQGAAIDMQDLFGGAVAADYREGDKAKSGERMKTIAVDANGLKLPDLSKFLRDGDLFDLALRGNANISTNYTVDPLFDSQPSGELAMTVAGLEIPAQTTGVPMNGVMMPVQLPDLKLGATKLSAKMANGVMDISDFTFGASRDPFSGHAKGTVGVTFRRDNMGVHPVINTYDLRVELLLRKEFAEQAKSGVLGLALLPVSGFARETSDGTRYAFRMQPPGPGGASPTFSAVQ